MKPKHIVILGYDGVMGSDLVGPMEAFTGAQVNSPKGGGDTCYRVTIAALGEKTFRSEFGLALTAERSLAGLRDVDTLLIHGGRACANQKTIEGLRPGCANMRTRRDGSRRSARESMALPRRDC